MAILYRCPECNQKLKIADRKIGHEISCPACGLKSIVTDPDAPAKPQSNDQPPVEEEIPPAASVPQQPNQDETELETKSPEVREPLPSEASGEQAEHEDSFFNVEDYGEESPAESAGDDETEASLVDGIFDAEDAATPPSIPPSVYYHDDEGDDDEEEGFTLSRRGGDDEEMDLTPMVDVTFLLLIFFMITASFSMQKTLEIPPPENNEKGATTSIDQIEEIENESIRVDISGENVISVDEVELTDPDGLEDRLMEIRAEAEGKNELLLVADDKSFHEMTIKVIDIANKIGIQKIRLATTADAGD